MLSGYKDVPRQHHAHLVPGDGRGWDVAALPSSRWYLAASLNIPGTFWLVSGCGKLHGARSMETYVSSAESTQASPSQFGSS